MMNDTLRVIASRRSIRKYKNQAVEPEKLEAILQAGTFAPTSRGLQSPYIVAVQDAEMRKQLAKMNAAVLGADFNPYYDAPVYILVFTSEVTSNPVQDGSCVLENMMIAAQSLGLGTCWIHREKEMFETEEGKALLQKMGLPATVMGIGALSLGYPDGEPSPAKPRKEGYYRII